MRPSCNVDRSYSACRMVLGDGVGIAVYVDSADSQSRAVLLPIHGYFSADSSGPSRIFSDLAQSARRDAISVVRYDWRGMGDSTGDIADNSLDIATKDLHFVAGVATEFFPTSPLFMVAHSVGCAVALEYCRKGCVPTPEGLILLSPGPLAAEELHLLCLDLGSTEKTFSRKGLTLSRVLLRSIASSNWYRLVANLPMPCLIACCSDDVFCPPQALETLASGGTRIVTYPRGGHNFASRIAKTETPKEIIRFVLEVCK